MEISFYQACYGHPDSGWSLINYSPELSRAISDDFLASERVNAAVVTNELIPSVDNGSRFCMMEIYCKNDIVGNVRTYYQLSDRNGRPISFSHGYLFPKAYDLLKQPEFVLGVKRENYVDCRIPEEEWAQLKKQLGALNNELIKQSTVDLIPSELVYDTNLKADEAMRVCGIDSANYCRLIKAIYSHVLQASAQKILYIKTDGTEVYARNLLFLIYKALPYSLRPLISASTMTHKEQRNTKIIFCKEVPSGATFFNPQGGGNNIFNDVIEKRVDARNPFLVAGVNALINGTDCKLYDSMETCLTNMGNARLNTSQELNLAYWISNNEHENANMLSKILFNWLSIPVPNSIRWEEMACELLTRAKDNNLEISQEIRELLVKRLNDSKTNNFSQLVNSCVG